MLNIKKRNGTIVKFNPEKIENVINLALSTSTEKDTEIAKIISSKIETSLILNKDVITDVETVQNMVEDALLEHGFKETARKYMRFRDERAKERIIQKSTKSQLLTDEFISKYKHLPLPMSSELGKFVYYRTYSRFLPEYGRRETWWETCRRAIEYNCSLAPTSREEAEKLFDNVFHLRQFPSGRTLWVGGTPVADEYGLSNFNCSFTIIDKFKKICDTFYLLMLGSGVGCGIFKSDVAKLPKIRSNFELIHEDYTHVNENKCDNTSLNFKDNNMVIITVGDSKEGWMEALHHYFDLITKQDYKNIKTIRINYNFVRPKGTKLKKFGGTASGHESLKNMFIKINKVIQKTSLIADTSKFNLRPINCLDILTTIGENVVSGGVRRTSLVMLFDNDDEECINAKSNLYIQKNGEFVLNDEIKNRRYSNNSIIYESKPTREQWHWHVETMRYSGEPAFMNLEAARKRRKDARGGNPCMEILLSDEENCNLSTNNVSAYCDDARNIDEKELLEAQWLSARAGYRMTCVELELPNWNKNLHENRLTGCSLTGWQDMVNITQFDKEEENELLHKMNKVATDAANDYAKQLGLPLPKLVTTVKPEGTISLLPMVSSGIHYSHSPYYIRRVRIAAHDPLCKVCEELEYSVFPELGETEENCNTKVIEFPVKSPEGTTKYDVSALEQMENYKRFMDYYVQHNVSCTIHVRPHEWEIVEQWVWDNWDDVVAMSFLSLDDSFYPLQPYETISKEEYEKRVSEMKPFDPSLISKYEVEETEIDIGTEGCEGGACPIR